LPTSFDNEIAFWRREYRDSRFVRQRNIDYKMCGIESMSKNEVREYSGKLVYYASKPCIFIEVHGLWFSGSNT
jgi:hypothetical protein